MIRVGFFAGASSAVWQGGNNYLRNLLEALNDLPVRRVETMILSGARSAPDFVADLRSARWHSPASLRRHSAAWVARKLMRTMMEKDCLLERDLRTLGIQVLWHPGQVAPGPRIPTLAWIADFQHVRLPQFFSARERRARNRDFASICRDATRILVSSASAQRDLAAFDGDAVAKSRVLRFVANVPHPRELASRAALEAKYGFEGRYFFLPNQFWIHKNHRVVVEALSVLKERGSPAMVLASGNPSDYRHPGHYAGLLALARSRGVADRFRPLGVVPYADLAALMWHSTAVINPSRFEGWSTTVEEAKSLGVPLLLSDIDVHREQQPPAALYFDPDDAEGLARAMRDFPDDRAARGRLAEAAARELPARRAEFARRFESYVLECLPR